MMKEACLSAAPALTGPQTVSSADGTPALQAQDVLVLTLPHPHHLQKGGRHCFMALTSCTPFPWIAPSWTLGPSHG